MKIVADKMRRIRPTVTADMASETDVENKRVISMLNQTLPSHQSAAVPAAAVAVS